ncbi:MAG: hypothetical protein OXP69_18725 [Spirochaetaceae bacterium]|nr:hypothetical protein [Spirochaetaceae bacterium]
MTIVATTVLQILMRRGEIWTLRRDIDAALGARGLGPRVVHVPHTKTGTPLELPITRQLAAILEWRRSNRRQRLGVPVAGEPVGP